MLQAHRLRVEEQKAAAHAAAMRSVHTAAQRRRGRRRGPRVIDPDSTVVTKVLGEFAISGMRNPNSPVSILLGRK